MSWHGKDACNLSTGDNLDKKCSWFYTKEKGCWKGWAQSSPCLRSCVRTSLLSDDLPSCRALPVYNRWFEHSKHKVKHFSRLSCPFLGFESSISHLCLKVVCLTSPSMEGAQTPCLFQIAMLGVNGPSPAPFLPSVPGTRGVTPFVCLHSLHLSKGMTHLPHIS